METPSYFEHRNHLSVDTEKQIKGQSNQCGTGDPVVETCFLTHLTSRLQTSIYSIHQGALLPDTIPTRSHHLLGQWLFLPPRLLHSANQSCWANAPPPRIPSDWSWMVPVPESDISISRDAVRYSTNMAGHSFSQSHKYEVACNSVLTLLVLLLPSFCVAIITCWCPQKHQQCQKEANKCQLLTKLWATVSGFCDDYTQAHWHV